jgi:hypothetical protein
MATPLGFQNIQKRRRRVFFANSVDNLQFASNYTAALL